MQFLVNPFFTSLKTQNILTFNFSLSVSENDACYV